MLDLYFQKYFTDKSDGEFFNLIINEIIQKNVKVKNENTMEILNKLKFKETNSFHEFKSLIEEHVKIFLFYEIKEILNEWKKRNIIKINAFERKEKYNLQNVPDGNFKDCYKIFQKNNEYFNGNYTMAIVPKIHQNLQELKNIYKSLSKDDLFLEKDYLLDLLKKFQEITTIDLFKIKNLELRNHEQNLITINKDIHNIRKNIKYFEQKKINPVFNFVIKFFSFGCIDKNKDIKNKILLENQALKKILSKKDDTNHQIENLKIEISKFEYATNYVKINSIDLQNHSSTSRYLSSSSKSQKM